MLAAVTSINTGIDVLTSYCVCSLTAPLYFLKVAQLKIDLAIKAIAQAKENKRILDNRFNAQVALLTDVLDADVFLLQAKTNLLNAQAEAIIANYKLQKSLGQL